PSNLTDESAELLAKVISGTQTDNDLEEEYTIKAKVAAACTLFVKASHWLERHPEVSAEIDKIINEALADPEEGISRRIMDRDEFQFVAYAVFMKWLKVA